MGRIRNVNGENIPFTAEEEAERDALDSAWVNGAAEREMASIRKHRDSLLRETDHYGLDDVIMTDAMKTYRQTLRAIPANNTLYADVNWPVKP